MKKEENNMFAEDDEIYIPSKTIVLYTNADISSLIETFVFPKVIKDLYPVLLFVKLVLELKQPNSVQIV